MSQTVLMSLGYTPNYVKAFKLISDYSAYATSQLLMQLSDYRTMLSLKEMWV